MKPIDFANDISEDVSKDDVIDIDRIDDDTDAVVGVDPDSAASEVDDENFDLSEFSPEQLDQLKEAVLKRQREQNRKTRAADINMIKSLVVKHDLAWSDIAPTSKGNRGPVAAKYRNPETGATWSGRGRRPLWINDENIDSFLISEEATETAK